MKKIFTILILIVSISKSYGQTYPIPYGNLGSVNTAIRDSGGLFVRQTFVPPILPDTNTFPLGNYPKNYNFSIAGSNVDTSLYYRYGSGWIKIATTTTSNPIVNIYNSNGTITTPRTVNGGNNNLSFTNIGTLTTTTNDAITMEANNNISFTSDVANVDFMGENINLSGDQSIGLFLNDGLLINNSAGDSNYVLTSQGSNFPPIWKSVPTGSSGVTDSALYHVVDSAGTSAQNNLVDTATAIRSSIPAGWSLTGNAGTTAGTNFLGTTDNTSFVFKINNNISGILDNGSGNITSFGYEALYDLPIPPVNAATDIAIGDFSLSHLQDNPNSEANVAVGTNSQSLNRTGYGNTSIGNNSMQDGTGSYNTIIGEATDGAGNYGLALGIYAVAQSNEMYISDSVDSVHMKLNGQVNGYVLTTNGTTATWQPASGGSGTVTSIGLTSSDLTVGGTSPITTSGTYTLTLPTINSNVGTFNNLTVNGKGQVTSASNVSYLTVNQPITVTATGDATGTSTSSGTAPSLPLTFATVNSNVGSFTNANITVNAKGLITAASNGSGGGGSGDTLFSQLKDVSLTYPIGTTHPQLNQITSFYLPDSAWENKNPQSSPLVNFFKNNILLGEGHSVMQGANAAPTSSSEGYVTASNLGVSFIDSAIGGSVFYNVIYRLFKNDNSVNPTTNLLLHVGINDYKGNMNTLRYCKEALKVIIANRLMSTIQAASSGTLSGFSTLTTSCSKSAERLGGNPEKSTTSGSTATYITSAGSIIAIGYYGDSIAGNLGQEQVTIDGVIEDTLKPSYKANTYYYAAIPPTSPDFRRPVVDIISGLKNVAHTVTITTLSNTECDLDYIGTLQNPQNSNGILVEHELHFSPAGFIYDGLTTTNGVANDRRIDSLNQGEDSVVYSFQQLGFNTVGISNTENYYNNINTAIATDPLHPNNIGHAELANANIAAIARMSGGSIIHSGGNGIAADQFNGFNIGGDNVSFQNDNTDFNSLNGNGSQGKLTDTLSFGAPQVLLSYLWKSPNEPTVTLGHLRMDSSGNTVLAYKRGGSFAIYNGMDYHIGIPYFVADTIGAVVGDSVHHGHNNYLNGTTELNGSVLTNGADTIGGQVFININATANVMNIANAARSYNTIGFDSVSSTVSPIEMFSFGYFGPSAAAPFTNNVGLNLERGHNFGIFNSGTALFTVANATGNAAFTGNITKINNVTTSFPSSQGAANTVLTNDGSGNLSWSNQTGIRYAHNISTPTTGGTVALVNNQYNIINPSGALLALTVNLPSSPANNDVVYIKFTQNVTTVTYGNGTVVDGITAPTAGGLTVLTYDSGTTSWY